VGAAQPVLLLGGGEARRQAVVLASGFWRWSAREGAGRDAYRRLWSSVAGWLLSGESLATAAEVRPLRRVVPRGEDVRWVVPGAAGDPVRLRIVLPDGSARDTTVLPGPDVSTGPLPPGLHSWTATRGTEAVGEGRFDVESRTDELLRLPQSPPGPPPMRAAGWFAPGDRRPLRTSPWPYALALALLCAEWVGRRRAGLR